MKKKQVLLAGNKSSLGAVEAALKGAGFGLIVADSAFAAFSELVKSRPSAVIIGSGLEDLKSYQLACLIKSGCKNPQLPVVVLDSNNGNPGFWTNAKLADLKIQVSKKEDVDNLVSRLSVLIDETEKFQESSADTWYPIVPSENAPDKYLHLIDDLLIERLMGQVSRLLIEVVEPRNQFLEQYFRLLTNVFDCEVVGIVVLSSNRPWLSLRANLPVKRKALEDFKDSVIKQLDAVKDIDVEFQGDVQDKSGEGIASFEVLPVVADKTNLGAIVFGSADKKGFDEATKLAMRHLQRMILPVMRLLLASQEIEVLYQKEMHRSSTDASTGLYNLEFLVGFLQQQLLFSYRQKSPVGLLIVDVDNLKSINDEFGYQIGDLVLSRMANKMLSMTRASDLIARYGGDEFAVVMPNADISGAKVLAEKIRLEMPTMNFVLPGQKKAPKVTVSIGCAGFNMEDLNPETILRDAKHALQRAKSSGGNKVSA